MSSFGEELLPGIRDYVTLTHIVTKLPWTAFNLLSSVSKNWQRAIRSGEVYRERVRSRLGEELLVVKHEDEVKCDDVLHRNCTYQKAISLYSMREKRFYQIPPIPHLHGGSERFCQLIASNGTLYVCSHSYRHINSIKKQSNDKGQISDDKPQVYSLDLAGKGQWRKCREIQAPEHANTCCSISCLLKAGGKPEHKFLGEGSSDWCPDLFNSFWCVVDSWRLGESSSNALPYEEVPEMSFTGDPRRVKVEPKKYLMTSPASGYPDIYVQDRNTRFWTHQHSVSCDEISGDIAPELGEDYPFKIEPIFAVPVNNEVLAIARWGRGRNHGYELLQSRGFGTDSKEISWEKISHSFQVEPSIFFGMCPILL